MIVLVMAAMSWFRKGLIAMCDVERSLLQLLDEDVYERVIEYAAVDGMSPRSIVNNILRGYYEVHGPMRVLVRERDEDGDEASFEDRPGIDLSHLFDDR